LRLQFAVGLEWLLLYWNERDINRIGYLRTVRILLDIDGVMVPAQSWKPSEVLPDGFAVFGSRAVAALQRIISETGASIVLTTSHKANFNLTEWHSIFGSRGITARIEKLNHNSGNWSRKDEILNWLNGQECQEDFVIIDDDKSLNALPAQIKDRLILTSAMVGLLDEHATMAIAVLRSAVLV
jgi:HAD domain in Swiss Army Knife RNA repair proteins